MTPEIPAEIKTPDPAILRAAYEIPSVAERIRLQIGDARALVAWPAALLDAKGKLVSAAETHRATRKAIHEPLVQLIAQATSAREVSSRLKELDDTLSLLAATAEAARLNLEAVRSVRRIGQAKLSTTAAAMIEESQIINKALEGLQQLADSVQEDMSNRAPLAAATKAISHETEVCASANGAIKLCLGTIRSVANAGITPGLRNGDPAQNLFARQCAEVQSDAALLMEPPSEIGTTGIIQPPVTNLQSASDSATYVRDQIQKLVPRLSQFAVRLADVGAELEAIAIEPEYEGPIPSSVDRLHSTATPLPGEVRLLQQDVAALRTAVERDQKALDSFVSAAEDFTAQLGTKDAFEKVANAVEALRTKTLLTQATAGFAVAEQDRSDNMKRQVLDLIRKELVAEIDRDDPSLPTALRRTSFESLTIAQQDQLITAEVAERGFVLTRTQRNLELAKAGDLATKELGVLRHFDDVVAANHQASLAAPELVTRIALESSSLRAALEPSLS